MHRQRTIAFVALVTVTLCPFNCVRHKASSVGYFVRVFQVSPAAGDRLLPPAPPRCENDTGCVCQGAIFVAPPQVDDQALQVYAEVDRWHDLLLSTVSDHGRSVPSRGFEADASPPAGRVLRALIASFQI